MAQGGALLESLAHDSIRTWGPCTSCPAPSTEAHRVAEQRLVQQRALPSTPRPEWGLSLPSLCGCAPPSLAIILGQVLPRGTLGFSGSCLSVSGTELSLERTMCQGPKPWLDREPDLPAGLTVVPALQLHLFDCVTWRH